jgi:hypothetical protein
MSNEMRLSEAIGRFGLVGVTKPSHAIPGVRSSHANPESYDNDCGMGSEFAGNALGLAMVFFAGRSLTKVKIMTSAQRLLRSPDVE